MGGVANVLDLEAEQAKRFLRDVRDHPFIAVVAYPNGDVCVFDKGVTPEESDRMRDAIEQTLEEGKG